MRRNRERTEALGDWLDLHLQDLIQVGKDSLWGIQLQALDKKFPKPKKEKVK